MERTFIRRLGQRVARFYILIIGIETALCLETFGENHPPLFLTETIAKRRKVFFIDVFP